MAQPGVSWIRGQVSWVCRQCRTRGPRSGKASILSKQFTTTSRRCENTEIQAAPEIDFQSFDDIPVRVLPASPSYFTTIPVFNDNLLKLEKLIQLNKAVPTLPADQAPRAYWMTLAQYRTATGETISASRYARLLKTLMILNRIHPELRHPEVSKTLDKFRRKGTATAVQGKVHTIDEYGRSFGKGKRKESSARVYLVEGTGEVLVNGKGLVQAFPRMHDRESVLWPLKMTERTDKYNVFALVEGGGTTGQAESITLALARALLVQEPALKPALRKVGCITSDARRVERKKPGRLKARKRPTWVKR